MLILLALDLYLTFVLGLFPWTRAVSFKLLEYLLLPLRTAATPLSATCQTCSSWSSSWAS